MSKFFDHDSPVMQLLIMIGNLIMLNILWLVFGGLWAWLMHVLFGVLLFVTVIGIPFAKQHFKMAGLSLAPFGKDVELHL